MDDGSTYGFSKPDAEDLLNVIGMRDIEFEELKPPSRGGLAIEFRVDGCQTLQYRVGGGSWNTMAVLRLRMTSGGDLQLSLDPSETPEYCNWIDTTECVEDP